MSITIFTDGSSRGNPGPGGWGSVVVMSEKVVELGGAEKNTTNNKMELSAVIAGLRKASEMVQGSMINDQYESQINLYSDSSYVINGITRWIHGWKHNGWKTKTKDDVLNKDLWIELDDVLNDVGYKNVSWKYVGGHIGIAGNERCDIIATSFADKKDVALFSGPLVEYSVKNILDVSHNEGLLQSKKTNSKSSKAKAYSYVSMVGDKVEIHHTWAECEKRVKGVRKARYKKALSKNDEIMIMKSFGGR